MPHREPLNHRIPIDQWYVPGVSVNTIPPCKNESPCHFDALAFKVYFTLKPDASEFSTFCVKITTMNLTVQKGSGRFPVVDPGFGQGGAQLASAQFC